MSSTSKVPESPMSNEDIINDLTKDLEASCTTREGAGASHRSDGTAANETSRVPSKGKGDYFDVLSDFDNPEEKEKKDVKDESKSDDSDTESVDEVALKDAEVELTEDQKMEKRICADALKTAGNERFKIGNYERSIEKYTAGLQICPLQFNIDRAILYSNRAAAKMKLEQHEKAIKDCTKAIEFDPNYIKAYLRRAQCYELKEKLDECLADYKKILELDATHKEAQKATVRLPPLIEERNEKLKTEMMGKLKDLGNMILKPFGLSTENFQLKQDPETKGYSVNFKQ